ncbi:phenylalanyl-tRNA synthetase beta chain [Methylacidimicrobium cyclopophantes]|uniref:Phenylalanine--tRNA ligase beta subunit n=1 Tax=Methylacidimicrobium cyclopophantes TaxID=1041766 RepID=A0A5E6MBS9_9BACT|nr:phenylalanine--tRNA ligase subunit beta [Methylacidimicrobium cyclopophantes]VVM06688.1 phenylalanyl-tRNA synthetase beta chain [Methylacidimicrobium cyclopophantes]
MKISWQWLSQYCECTVPVEEAVDRLTMSGLEVTHWRRRGPEDPRIVVAEVVDWKPHPGADRLRLVRVRIPGREVNVVCGAANFDRGDRVALALVGAVLPGGLEIARRRIRGEDSEGMLCSAEELGLEGKTSDGILLLPADSELGASVGAVLPTDIEWIVEVTPNRPDLLSYLGVARELAALGCGRLLPFPWSDSLSVAEPFPGRVLLGAPDVAPWYSAALLEGIEVKPSPPWLQERLRGSGARPINIVVDVTNFVLFELGEPLHAFDADAFPSWDVTVRRAMAGERLVTLADQEVVLDPADLVIASKRGPEALAGVIGGKRSAVSEKTGRVLLECAWFRPTEIRATARRHSLSTEASYRFERRVDPGIVWLAQERAIQLLCQWAGAKLVGTSAFGALPLGATPIWLQARTVERLCGELPPAEEVEGILERLGLQLAEKNEKGWLWNVPSYRGDLEGEADLVEEIVRMRGLAALPSRVSVGWARKSRDDHRWDRREAVRSALAARGWQECISLPFAATEPVEIGVELSNPANVDFRFLRSQLGDGLIEIARTNWAKGNRSLRLFELGRVVHRRRGRVEERERLAILAAGKAQEAHWLAGERDFDFYDLKGLADFLENVFAIPREARVRLESISREVSARREIDAELFLLEYDLESWLSQKEGKTVFRPLPIYPPIRRDIAVVVDEAVTHAEICRVVESIRLSCLEEFRLFDLFRDPSAARLPAGKKSLAYALTFRSPDRTLTDKEVNGWLADVRTALRSQGWSLREA